VEPALMNNWKGREIQKEGMQETRIVHKAGTIYKIRKYV
jgi:hypothetical protein